MPELEGLNSQVLAISCDAISSKQGWGVSLGGISYPLVSDFWPHGEMSSAYGVFNAEFGRPDRAFIVVDQSGIVRWIRLFEPGILPDNEELLAALREMKS